MNTSIFMHFDGATYEPSYDRSRLSTQMLRVFYLMLDQTWRTLAEISSVIGAPEASVSARLRDMRKPRYGSHNVERRRRGDARRGLFEYRLASKK